MGGRTVADNDRYGRILRRIWFDEMFQAWSAPPPCAQFLWFYLCTTPRAGSIPGVFTLSLEETAKRLRWSLEDTRRVFAEIVSQGRAEHDEKTDLLYIPSALRHDSPHNPNVVKSWRRQWTELPPCHLKERVQTAFGQYLSSVGGGFVEAWAIASGWHGTIPATTSKPLAEPPSNSFTSCGDAKNPANSPNGTVSKPFQEDSSNRVETPSETLNTESESVSPEERGAGGGLSRGAKLVRLELERGRQLWPAAEVSGADLDAMAERIAFDTDDPVNRASGEYVVVARDAVRAARKHKAKFALATPTDVLQQVETATGWIFGDYRSGKRKRTGGADGAGPLDHEQDNIVIGRTLRENSRSRAEDDERRKHAVDPSVVRDLARKLSPPPFAS